ncbi:MAG: SGNH/GDSL hydrolase family protein [Acetobacteraceae bacterium]
MRIPGSWLLPLLLLALPAPVPAAAADAVPVCPGAGELSHPARPLARVGAALAAGQPLTILAVGSATTAGEQANGAKVPSFPARMAEALRARLPDSKVELTVHGRRGLTAQDMLTLIRQALAKQPYTLVLWQTGTVEAVRRLPPDRLRATLDEGIGVIRAAGGDVVLIDPPFSRFLRANANLDPYEDALIHAASTPGVVLFHRFDLMRTWVYDDRIDLERVKKAEREAAVAHLNECLGQALAQFIVVGAKPSAH